MEAQGVVTGPKEVDLEYAKVLFDIRLADGVTLQDIDDTAIQQTFYDRFSNSVNKFELAKALQRIAEEKTSSELKDVSTQAFSSLSQVQESRSLSEPRGLENKANFCYLNALLQYLFTIREVRESVMSFEEDLSMEDADQTPETSPKPAIRQEDIDARKCTSMRLCGRRQADLPYSRS